MNILDEIFSRKKEHIATRKALLSLHEVETIAAQSAEPLGFINSIKSTISPAIIAEVKKSSPSKGIIREDFDPVEIAKSYERAGAACVSILTDEPYFQGHDDFLIAIKQATSLPALRKDFMIDPYQIYESRALGADCILLIMAALSDLQAAELYTISEDLGMDILVEVHNKEELTRALDLNPVMIGINNRNLKTMEVNIQTSHELAKNIPDTILKVAESGISNAQTIKDLEKSSYRAFLIGESLMRQENIEIAFKKLL